MARRAGPYESALKVLAEIESSENRLASALGRGLMKIILFVIMKKIFNKPYDPDFLIIEAEIVMSPEEIIDYGNAGNRIFKDKN